MGGEYLVQALGMASKGGRGEKEGTRRSVAIARGSGGCGVYVRGGIVQDS